MAADHRAGEPGKEAADVLGRAARNDGERATHGTVQRGEQLGQAWAHFDAVRRLGQIDEHAVEIEEKRRLGRGQAELGASHGILAAQTDHLLEHALASPECLL